MSESPSERFAAGLEGARRERLMLPPEPPAAKGITAEEAARIAAKHGLSPFRSLADAAPFPDPKEGQS